MKLYLNTSEVTAHLRRAHLSQGDIAERVGTTRPHFNRLLNGYHAPTPQIRRALEQVLSGVGNLWVER